MCNGCVRAQCWPVHASMEQNINEPLPLMRANRLTIAVCNVNDFSCAALTVHLHHCHFAVILLPLKAYFTESPLQRTFFLNIRVCNECVLFSMCMDSGELMSPPFRHLPTVHLKQNHKLQHVFHQTNFVSHSF